MREFGRLGEDEGRGGRGGEEMVVVRSSRMSEGAGIDVCKGEPG